MLTRRMKRPPTTYLAAATRDAGNILCDALAWVVVNSINNPVTGWLHDHIIDRGAYLSRRIGGDE